MLDTIDHMLLLLQQAQIKNEKPQDESFLPLSLVLACLLRQLPTGLAPPVGMLSFHQLDRLPKHILEKLIVKLLLRNGSRDDNASHRVVEFVCSIVMYAKITRALLMLLHDHLLNNKSAHETTQEIIKVVVADLNTIPESQDEDENEDDTQSSRSMTSSRRSQLSKHQEDEGTGTKRADVKSAVSQSATTAMAVDPSGIMKRAVSRDTGDGTAVLEIMRKYPTDERIQTHGVRALKGVIRKYASNNQIVKASSHPEPSSRQYSTESDESDESDEEEDDAIADGEASHTQPNSSGKQVEIAIQMVISKMKQCRNALGLQRDGLLCLSEYVHIAGGERNVAIVAATGGVMSIIDALARLPDDLAANIAGLSVLAHPHIAADSVVRVNPESRRLVLSAMQRFPQSEQIQGLSCLALGNLSLRQDESLLEIVNKGGLETVVAAMKRFQEASLVQAAGCRLFGIVSAKNNELATACLEAGALPVCEKSRIRFPLDQKVQEHAIYAIRLMLADEEDVAAQQEQGQASCTLQ